MIIQQGYNGINSYIFYNLYYSLNIHLKNSYFSNYKPLLLTCLVNNFIK
ncbi:hypothetical protein HYG84_13415 [Alkaliphilus sp. B6464]|nr:hypothetical protein HYG84_13415 [Alkaliphilus sp. B6464]